MKKILSLVLALMLVLSLAPAALAEEKPVVTIGLKISTNVEDYDTNTYTLLLEEMFGVDIQFYLMDDPTTKLPVLVASNSELPDLIFGTLDNATTYNFAQQGALIPLTQYWNDPEMTKNFDGGLAAQNVAEGTREKILAAVTMPDGEIYTLPKYDENFWNLAQYRALINKTWLEKLGLEQPTNAEELVNVLTHFVNDDPNGNGKKDEIGLVSAASGYGLSPLVWIMNSFIHANPAVKYFNVDDGKVSAAFTQDAFKEGLMFCKQLYDAGLLAPESFTQDRTQLKAEMNAEEAICGIVLTGFDTDFEGARAHEYVVLAPVEGPAGVRYVSSRPAATTGIAYVTRDAEDPALCFAIAECTYDMTMRWNFRNGIEDVHWTYDPDVVAQYKGKFEILTGAMPNKAQINNIWGKPGNVVWNAECTPFISSQWLVMRTASILKTEENKDIIDLFDQHYAYCKPYEKAELLDVLIYNEEESANLALIQSVIDSYVTESMTAFVTGDRDISEWDAYVSELNDMGLEEYLAIQQAAYDRSVGK